MNGKLEGHRKSSHSLFLGTITALWKQGKDFCQKTSQSAEFEMDTACIQIRGCNNIQSVSCWMGQEQMQVMHFFNVQEYEQKLRFTKFVDCRRLHLKCNEA
jgi:hypothetical protein